MAVVGALRVDLGLDSAEFQAGMKRAEASMANFGKSASSMGRAANDLGVSTARVMQRQAQLGFQLQDLAVQIQGGANPFTALLQQGSQVQAVYSGQGGFGQVLRDMGTMATGLVTKFWPLAAVVGVVAGGIAALTGEINKTAGATVGFGDVAVATWQLFAEGVYGIVQPAIEAIGGWFSNLWSMIAPYIGAAVNGIIGGFVGAFEAIKATWSALPGALGDLVYQAANATVTSVQYMIRTVQVEINKFLAGIDRGLLAAGMNPLGLNVGAIDITGIDNPFAGQAAGVAGSASAAFAGAQGDYLGQWASAIGERARANMAAVKEELKETAGAAGGANNKLKELAEDGMDTLASSGRQIVSRLARGFADMFKGLITGSKSAMQSISELLGKLGDMLLNQGFQALFGGLFGGGGQWGVMGGFPGFKGMFGLPSFAGGGYTGPGSGPGLDGKGGFLAMLHPDETVVDHSKGQGFGPSVAISISGSKQDAAAIAREVRKVLPDAIQNYNRNPLRRPT